MKNLIAIACALGFAVGCGGGDDDTLLREATVEEARDLCEYANDHLPGAATCMVDGQEIEVEAEEPQDCSAVSGENDVPATCDATIGDYEDCLDALEADPCAFYEDEEPPAACAPIFTEDCLGG